ncbi:MAG: hypothetical protein RL127_1550 [Bacteroidota bacterium]
MPVTTPANYRHLLARTLFGFSTSDFEKAMGYGSLATLVDQAILAPVATPAPPNSWVSLVPAQAQQDSGDAGRWYTELTQWWNKRMFNQGLNMQEKVVLFLHNHFSCERDKVNYPQCISRISCYVNMLLGISSSS